MHQLTLRVPQEAVEPLSDLLMEEFDALAVSVEDADAGTEAEQALFGEPGLPAARAAWERSTLQALFSDDRAAEQAAAALLADEHTAALVQLQALSAVPDEDWVRLTQAQFAPVEITPSFWIVPSWHEVPPQATRAMRLDPGLAFGTGTHATTRMCLRWLAGHATPVAGARVLDYGCGSGILAIGAAMFGATEVDAVDIDPAAVAATLANAQANTAAMAAPLARVGLPDAAHGTYGLVLANILATPLKILAPLLCGHLAPGGRLLLAGLLSRQADELIAVYAPWLQLHVADEQEDWALLAGQRAGT
jgi:ribosomal protein L11 methyltransferase